MRILKQSKTTAIIGSALLVCVGCSQNHNSAPAADSTSASSVGGGTTSISSMAIGSSATYNGMESVQITFASPNSKERNSKASYTTTEAVSILASPSGSVAPIDIHKEITYTATSAPTYGTQPQSKIVDQFVSVDSTSSSVTVSLAQTVSKDSGFDITAALEAPAGAPYSVSQSSTTTFTSPSTIINLPLAEGETWSRSLARSATSLTKVLDASSNVYAQSNITTMHNADNSYSESGQSSLTSIIARTLLSDGSGSTTKSDLSGVQISKQTVGLPSSGTNGWSIPVSLQKSSTSSVMQFQSADWFPGGEFLAQSLGSRTFTVGGTISSLPADCDYHGSQTNMTEYDASSSKIDPVTGTYTIASSRIFSASGLPVCALSTSTTKSYDLKTGALSKTTVRTTSKSLNE